MGCNCGGRNRATYRVVWSDGTTKDFRSQIDAQNEGRKVEKETGAKFRITVVKK